MTLISNALCPGHFWLLNSLRREVIVYFVDNGGLFKRSLHNYIVKLSLSDLQIGCQLNSISICSRQEQYY